MKKIAFPIIILTSIINTYAMEHELIRFGMSRPEAVPQKSIFKAIENSDLATLKALIASGADLEEKQGGCSYPLNTPLLRAAQNPNFIEGLELLIRSGANVKAKSGLQKTAFHEAANRFNFAAIPILKKTDLNINEKDYFDDTPLFTAVFARAHVEKWKANKLKTIQALIDAGADVNSSKENGDTPLHAAIPPNETDVIKLLVGNGALLEVTNNAHETALQKAVNKDMAASIITLIELGANIDILDGDNKSLLDLAQLRAFENNSNSLRALVTTVSPKEIQHIVPTIGSLTKRPTTIGKDVGRTIIAQQLKPAIVSKKLALAKQYLPTVPEAQLRQEIINSFNRVIRNSPKIQATEQQFVNPHTQPMTHEELFGSFDAK